MIIWQLDLELPVQSVPITTNIVSSNPAHDEVYSIQHLCDKILQRLAAGRWFSPGTPISSTNKTDCHDIIEILLKVALNTLTPLYCIGQLNNSQGKRYRLKCLKIRHIFVLPLDLRNFSCKIPHIVGDGFDDHFNFCFVTDTCTKCTRACIIHSCLYMNSLCSIKFIISEKKKPFYSYYAYGTL